MEVIENKVASGETIVLDDKHFVGCRYKDCKLIYSGGDFTSTETAFENCQIILSGAAQKTAAFLGRFGILKPPAIPSPLGGPPKPAVH
jgi:hypothetical protein